MNVVKRRIQFLGMMKIDLKLGRLVAATSDILIAVDKRITGARSLSCDQQLRVILRNIFVNTSTFRNACF